MAWHDETPWMRKLRKRHKSGTPGRIAEITRQCRAGEISLDGAIVAAYAAGLDDGVTLERDKTASAHVLELEANP